MEQIRPRRRMLCVVSLGILSSRPISWGSSPIHYCFLLSFQWGGC